MPSTETRAMTGWCGDLGVPGVLTRQASLAYRSQSSRTRFQGVISLDHR